MEIGKLAIDEDHLSQALETGVFQVGNESFRDLHVHAERCDHLMMDRCNQGGKQISLLLLQLESFVDRHIFESKHLALLAVKVDIHAIYDEPFVFLLSRAF